MLTISKKYSKEFKMDIVSLVADQGYSGAEAARRTSPAKSGKNAPKDGERHLKNGDGLLCRRNDVKYSVITQQKNSPMPIQFACCVRDGV